MTHQKTTQPKKLDAATRRALHDWLVAVAFNAWLRGLFVPTPTEACVARVETGSDWTMHGATYSTAYGVINEIVREYGTPAVAAKVFAGTASPQEQTDIIRRFVADHGWGGWGVRTREVCAL